MNESRPGPSGIKNPKISKKVENSVWNRYPLTEEQLLQYLMDSDDDIKDPDYSESDSEFEDSDDEEPEDICTGDDLNTSSALDFPPVLSPLSPPRPHTPSAQGPPPQGPLPSVEDIPTVIPFSKQRELLIQPDGNTPLDFFNLLVTDELLELIARETNIYAEEVFLSGATKEKSRITAWKDVTVEELKRFIGLLLHLGTIKLNRLQDYWKTHRLFNLPAFKNYRSRDQFMLIFRCLHFSRNPLPGQEKPSDRLYKIKPLINDFNLRMSNLYYPGKELSLEEWMVLWQGRAKKA
ncbi:hypothetical protein JTB14_033339 [Gonioctena quinquepunctata]|nr:hypothetical protein JTB14_033339 [Gonioctena quinquepunctata]